MSDFAGDQRGSNRRLHPDVFCSPWDSYLFCWPAGATTQNPERKQVWVGDDDSHFTGKQSREVVRTIPGGSRRLELALEPQLGDLTGPWMSYSTSLSQNCPIYEMEDVAVEW